MILSKHRVHLGLSESFRILHLSDSHLCLADSRDGEWKMRMAEQRGRWANRSEENFIEQLSYAREQGLPVFHTGDLSDFVSHANLERAEELLRGIPYFITPGNHEFMRYVDPNEFLATPAYKTLSYDRVQARYANRLSMDSRLIGGVNFVALDNGFYDFDEQQLAFLRAELDKGHPTVLMMHIPLYSPEHCAFLMQPPNSRRTAIQLAAPEELLNTYSDYDRFEQSCTPLTREMADYIRTEPRIRCVLCGHTHLPYQAVLPSGAVQLTVGAGMDGYAQEIEFY